MSALTNPVPSPVQQPPKRITPVAPQEAPRKPFPWKGWLVFGLIVAGSWFGYQRWQQMQRDSAQRSVAAAIRTGKVTTGMFVRTIRVAGTTAARQYANITAPRLRGFESRNQMELLRIVKNGTWVKPGQELAQVDPGAMVDHVDDIKSTITQSESDVKKRIAEQMVELESLEQTLRVAKSSVDKAKLELQAAEVRTDIERELLKLSFDESEARYKQSQLDMPQKKIVQGAEIKILGFTKERHVRHRNRHENDIRAYTVNSPMEGLVVLSSQWRGGEMTQVQQGDQLNPGQPLMKVVNPKSMQVEANINQAESTDMRIGQEATIGIDAFTGLQLKGKIYSIGALAVGGWRQNYYIRTVPVKLDILTVDNRVIPDLSAFADVAVESKADATMVPLGAVRDEDGKKVVYVKKGEGFEKRPVTLGSANNTHAVVMAGLTAGEEVRLD
ncbi:MAG: HlyD family efflux transporter periplasmic adaptor subunit [Bryobacterales bacterium]|nr:HlyD family efflux transporter periplasmic adaptor subunit [Bryobacterales bacterium]